MDFILKAAKRKLPLHENSFVKATAPYLYIKDKYKRIKQRNEIGVETNISTPIIPAIYKINQ